jgi:hypothetical protein
LPNNYLEKVDRATMAASIEGRVPFLSELVAEPARARDAFGKDELVAYLRASLPELARPARKVGLAMPTRPMSRIFQEERAWLLGSAESPLTAMVPPRLMPMLRQRGERSAAFEFRLSAVGVWARHAAT